MKIKKVFLYSRVSLVLFVFALFCMSSSYALEVDATRLLPKENASSVEQVLEVTRYGHRLSPIKLNHSPKAPKTQAPTVELSQQKPIEAKITAVVPQDEPETEWCLMFYVQASNNLSKFAKNNLQAMAEIGSRNNFHIVVQWHQPWQQGIWRYRVENGKVELKFSDEKAQTKDCAKNLIDFVAWSAKNYPAKRYALILWNHGVGILDPLWGNPMPVYATGEINPRIEIEGYTVTQDPILEYTVTQTTIFESKSSQVALDDAPEALTVFDLVDEQYDAQKNNFLQEQMQIALNILSSENRGVLFDEYNHTYLNNQGMVYALKYIKEKILFKKLDVLGIDACLMAMAEVMLQVQDYADYFVASQEVELAQGWDYKGFLSRMVGRVVTPQDLVKNIVATYETLYKGRTQLYTQSAIALDKMDGIHKHIDQVAAACKVCISAHGTLFKSVIKRARGICLQFSTPTYIDLHSFYTELSKQIDVLLNSDKKNKLKEVASLGQLKLLLSEGMHLITDSVIANTASSNLCRAQGISIYYPRHFIDASYLKTDFVQDNHWLEFLALNLEH